MIARPLALAWRGAVAVCALLNVAALLAWVYDLGAFHLWFLATGLPGLVVVMGSAVVLSRRPSLDPYLRRAIVAGTVGGLVGTIGYDLFRVPFLFAGFRLLAPIDSYGVLLLDAARSSSTTGFAGWGYHFANGMCFGIAYAVLAVGRRWPWAVVWGAVLETATVVTPFATSYDLRGKWGVIAIAYAAHVAYGVPLGIIVHRAAHWDDRRPLPLPAWTPVAALLIAMVLVFRPTPQIPSQPATDIVRARFDHEWIRIAPGECADLTNRDDVSYDVPGGPTVGPGETVPLCLDDVGASRIKLTPDAYSGGFVLVDPEA